MRFEQPVVHARRCRAVVVIRHFHWDNVPKSSRTKNWRTKVDSRITISCEPAKRLSESVNSAHDCIIANVRAAADRHRCVRPSRSAHRGCAALEKRVREILAELQNRYRATPLALMSALRAGADRLARGRSRPWSLGSV